jgi:hypothetical protein
MSQGQQIHLARLFEKMAKSGYRIIIDEIMRLRAEYQNDPTNAYSISPEDVTLCIEKKMEWGWGLFPVELR